MTDRDILNLAKRVLEIEASAIAELIPHLGKNFTKAVNLLYACKGRIVVTGMGKSGLIGKKIAATFASTGTPALFLHPAEGTHGDLGMIARGDVVVAISNSGETLEILNLLPTIKRLGIQLITMIGKKDSTLGKKSDVVLNVSVKEEACPFNLVPTASTTAALAMGDALVIALLDKRGFKKEDFALFHPGGSLGRKLLLKVADVMHTGTDIPAVNEDTLLKDALFEITSKKLGMTTVSDKDRGLLGVITDGDLRRLLEKWGINIFDKRAGEVMTRKPKVMNKDALAASAVQLMEKHSITALVIIDEKERIEGIVHLHDLLKMGVV